MPEPCFELPPERKCQCGGVAIVYQFDLMVSPGEALEIVRHGAAAEPSPLVSFPLAPEYQVAAILAS